jgi:hypothetical protein
MDDWWEELPAGKNWQFGEGVSSDNYRLTTQTDLSGKAGKMKNPDREEAGFSD